MVMLIVACQAEPEKASAGLIPMDKMGHILRDIHLTEARVNKLALRSSDSSRLVYNRLEKNVFRKYGVDTATYNRSYNYYSSEPAKMIELYKQINEELGSKKDTLNKK